MRRETADDLLGVGFTPNEWVRVVTDTADNARRFFGAPDGWPVRFIGFRTDRPGRVWEVLARGLIIK